jgi:hypothetical protein
LYFAQSKHDKLSVDMDCESILFSGDACLGVVGVAGVDVAFCADGFGFTEATFE